MQQVVDFILEIDKLKRVTRKIRPLGLDRYENPAEHSWQIAMLASSLAPHAPPSIDLSRVIAMLLVHDIGEIDAGDTFFFAEDSGAKSKERACVERIFALLPEPQRSAFLALWIELDENETAEARFAHAVDRAMPVLLNLANHGQSWRENGVSHAQVVGRVGPPIRAGCPALWAHIEARLDEALRDGWFGTRER
ncbi:HD domain-containing protein [Sandaracinus amylolyticus]|uniref:HD domain-containing protein n=1 Tax=Sandaracinus amylolyticus TaxID=927083 RepID=UPI001F3E1E60|nr:HD domain-containing protein [Sandaracinus amylolyticus]UJR78508.1 Metal-dependent phosphohydrolase HD sub domain [Sandaracinus amylolyticus]